MKLELLPLLPTPAGLPVASYATDDHGDLYVRAERGADNGVWFRRANNTDWERLDRGHNRTYEWRRPDGIAGGWMQLCDLIGKWPR